MKPYGKRSRETANKNQTGMELLPVPKLKHGNDESIARELDGYIDEAESGLRAILKTGYFIELIASDLPRGQLGPWVKAHCRKRSWRSVRRWKQIAASLADKIGIPYSQRIGLNLPLMLATPLALLPPAAQKVRERIEAEVEGKTLRQLFLTLSQVDPAEDDFEIGIPKIGRLKGSPGNSSFQRWKAGLVEERMEMKALTLEVNYFVKWMREVVKFEGKTKRLGTLPDKTFLAYCEALENHFFWCSTVRESRMRGRDQNRWLLSAHRQFKKFMKCGGEIERLNKREFEVYCIALEKHLDDCRRIHLQRKVGRYRTQLLSRYFDAIKNLLHDYAPLPDKDDDRYGMALLKCSNCGHWK